MSQPVYSSSLQNSKNSNAINDILQQQPQYYDSIKKDLPPQVLAQLGSVLLQQRKQLKINSSVIIDKVSDLQAQLQQQKSQLSQVKEYVKVLQQQCQNLRNLISYKEQDSQKRYAQLSQSSCSMIDQINQQLKKQRQINWQLKHLAKQLNLKQSQIRRLSIDISKITQQNESLKQLINWNSLLSQQLMQTEQKLADSKQIEKKLRQEVLLLCQNITVFEQRIAELQYIANNQQSKAKDVISQDFQTHRKNKVTEKQVRHFDDAKLLKQLQQNFHPQLFVQQVKRQNSQRHVKTQQDFENSLDNISQNWDKISLKQIEASSKSKPLIENIFNVHQFRSFDSSIKQKKLFQSSEIKKQQAKNSEKINNFKESPQHNKQEQLLIPLSIQRNSSKKQQTANKDIIATKPKPKVDLKIKIPQNQGQLSDMPLSTRSQHVNKISNKKSTFETPQQDLVKQVRNRAQTNSGFHKVIGYTDNKLESKIKQKKILKLEAKLLQFQKRNKQLQEQNKQLQKTVQNQTKVFKQQAYFQIQSIQRLTNQLKQSKLQNLRMSEQQKKYQQKLMQKINQLTNLCSEHQKFITQQQIQITKQKQAVSQLSQRLLQMQQQKWQLHNSRKIQKQDKNSQTIKTINNNVNIAIKNIYELPINYQKQKKQISINTTNIKIKNQYCQTYDKQLKYTAINTQINFVNNQNYMKHIGINTEQNTIKLDKQIQSINQANINKQIQTQYKQIKAQNKQTQTQDKQIKVQNKQIQTQVKQIKVQNKQIQAQINKMLSINKIQDISLACLQYANKLSQTDNEQLYKQIQPIIELKVNQKNKKRNGNININRNKNKNKYKNDIQQNQDDWPIKQFKPTPFIQQLQQQYEIQKIIEQQQKIVNSSSSHKQVKKQIQNNNQQNQNINLNQTKYYSFIEQYPSISQNHPKSKNNKQVIKNNKKSQISMKSNYQKQSNFNISSAVKLHNILTSFITKFPYSASTNLPNINSIKTDHSLKLSDIIARIRKNTSKQFYIMTALLYKQKQTFTDTVMFWKQGIASLKLNSCLMMLKAKKYINDPINLILGNSQIIVEKNKNLIEINRKSRNGYFEGDIQDCKWTVLNIQGYGIY